MFLIKQHAIQTHGGTAPYMEVSGQSNIPFTLPLGKQPPNVHYSYIGSCVCPTTGLEAVEKKKIHRAT
jgi:hypothetical protein